MGMETFHDGSMKPHESDETVKQLAPLHHIERQATGLVDAFVEHLRKNESVGDIEIIGMHGIIMDKQPLHHVKT